MTAMAMMQLPVMAYIMDERFREPMLPTEPYYNGILEGYRQNGLPVRALKAAWQHCVQEVERETAEINRKADALTKRKGNKNRER